MTAPLLGGTDRERGGGGRPLPDSSRASLLHFAAEAHRRKWAFEYDDPAAFDALHRPGDELYAAWRQE